MTARDEQKLLKAYFFIVFFLLFKKCRLIFKWDLIIQMTIYNRHIITSVLVCKINSDISASFISYAILVCKHLNFKRRN